MITEATIPEEERQIIWQRLKTLQEEVGPIPEEFFPNESVKGPFYFKHKRFDINRFLEAFNLVKLDYGYVLDYFYEYDGIGGYPIPFTRKEDDNAIPLLRELSRQKIEKGYFNFGNLFVNLHFEKSSSGYFQFAVFSQAVCQFYLFWHADYNDSVYILSQDHLDGILRDLNQEHGDQFSPSQLNVLKEANLNPRIKIKGDDGEIKMVNFTKWGGFSYETLNIRWPNRIVDRRREEILSYDCGIVF